jgi:uncharacterized protein (TIGR03083 family)
MQNRHAPFEPDAEMRQAMVALAAEIGALGALLETRADSDWERPTRLPGWSVMVLVAHIAGGVSRVPQYAATPVDGPPERDRLTYWRFDASIDAGVTTRALNAARGQTPDSLRAALRENLLAAQAITARLPATTVIPSIMGPIALVEYLPSRILEVCVHGLDLRDALGAPATPTPDALASTVSTLEGLLAGPRPPDLDDDVAFVEAATGRRPHADPRLPVVR